MRRCLEKVRVRGVGESAAASVNDHVAVTIPRRITIAVARR